MDNFTDKDVNKMSWNEVDELILILLEKINAYFSSENSKVDVIAPLLRTGGIVGGLISIKKHIVTMLPVQFKYTYNPTKIIQISSIPDLLIDIPKEMNILLCEGNTSSGKIAVEAAKAIKKKYPQAKIHLATLTKVFGGPERLEGIEEIFYGRLTDEGFKATEADHKKLDLRKGITIFPWENVDDELSDINVA